MAIWANWAIIGGKLGGKPELSYTPKTQTACCRLSVAVKGRKKDDPPTWVRVTVWGPQGENCERWLEKGQEVLVRGSIRITKGKDGKEYFEIVADEVEFGAKPSNNQTAPTQAVEQVAFTQIDDAPPF